MMGIGGFLCGLLFALRRPKSSPTPEPAVRAAAPQSVERRTLTTQFCGKPHSIKTGEPLAHLCRVLPVEALEAESNGQSLIAARIMARRAAMGPLPEHAGVWKLRRR